MRFLILCTMAGAFAGLVGGLFHLTADAALAMHVSLGAIVHAAPETHDAVARLLGPLTAWLGEDRAVRMAVSALLSAAMIAAAIFLVRRFAPEAGGSGIPEVEGAIAARLPLRWGRVLPVKFVGGVLSIGSGAVVGREGPTIHIGASLAEWLGELASLDGIERRGILSAGAAAGLAAAFNAPVASVLFVMEETREEFPYSVSTVTGVILACIASAIATGAIIGPGAMLPIEVATPPAGFVYFALALGAGLGLAGLAFNRGLIAGINFMQARSGVSRALLTLVIGAALGALLVYDISTVEGGEGLITKLVVETDPLSLLVLLVLARFVLTIFSYGLGVPGGLFAPILALAACLGLMGAALGNLAALPFPVPSEASAVIAMAGLFASTVRAPMVGVVLTAELTGSFDLLLPLLACAGAAHLVAEGLGNRPIYQVLLERRLASAPSAAQPAPR